MTALFVALEREIPDFDPYVNGHALSEAERELEPIAKQLGAVPLMEFFGQDPDDAAAFVEGNDADAVDIPDEAWFDATEGLRTVDALLRQLVEHPATVQKADRILAELKEWHAVLSRAAAEGVRWHLSVDF